MKKYFTLISAALLALAGCSKEAPMTSTTSYTFEVNADQVATKAVIDGDGDGANVDRFIMEVYLNKNGELKLFDRQVAAPTSMSPAKTQFKLTLVKDQEYDVLFWADKCGASLEEDLYYNTADLREVSIMDTYVGNDDARDAFSKMEVITPEMSRNGFAKTIQLTRPFAQVNFITTDIDDIMKTTSADEFLPTNVKAEFYGFTKFNVLDQTASEPAAFVSEAAVYSKTEPSTSVTEYTLSMDYVLTLNATEKEMHDLALTAYAGDYELTKIEVANAPVQRNYRTNVKGNLLTTVNEFVVEIDPIWNEPDYDVIIWDGTIEEVPEDANGEIHITTAAQLAGLSADVAKGITYAGKTVILDNDIDLCNVAWKPIGNLTAYPGQTFAGVFDGNNMTISNLNASDYLEDYATAGLFGSIKGTVKNVKVSGATVKSSHYAGVICGYSDQGPSSIENCTVENATVVSTPELIGGGYDNGDKVGGIVGYITAACKVSGCTVTNTTIEAYRDLGAIVGCATGDAVTGVTDNTAKDCKVLQSCVNAYKTNVTTYEAIVGRHDKEVPASNVAENVVLSVYSPEGIIDMGNSTWGICSADGLKKMAEKLALNEWSTKFVLESDIDLAGEVWVPVKAGVSGDYTNVLDGNGYTISNFTLAAGSDAGLFGTFGGTIKNLTVKNVTAAGELKRAGVLVGQMGVGSVENCTVADCKIESTSKRVGALVGHSSANVNFTGCTVDNVELTGSSYVGGLTGTVGSGDATVASVISGCTVKNTTIKCSGTPVEGSYGAFVGDYFIAPVDGGSNVAENNTIDHANDGFGIHE